MNHYYLITSILLFFTAISICDAYYSTPARDVPQQIHIAFFNESSAMSVTWFVNSTSSPSILDSTVQLRDGVTNYPYATGSAHPYDPTSGWQGYVHVVILTGLQPNTQYFYKCGSQITNKWSDEYSFTTMFTFKQGSKLNTLPLHFAFYGDMGFSNTSYQTIKSINQKRQTQQFDAVFHIGDIAYADFDGEKQGYQNVWGEFLNEVQNLSASVPYMVCPGNHDVFYGGAPFLNTFPTPAGYDKMWYSFTYENIRFISISTELWLTVGTPQGDWLREQLRSHAKDPNKPTWLIVYAHRPYYCSNAWSWCTNTLQRKIDKEVLEPLFYEHNVDFFFGGHTHSYERSYPVNKDEIKGDYNNPGATIHFVVGNAGAQEDLDMDWQKTPDWSANHSSDLGWGYLTVFNDTHVQWQMIFSENNTVADEVWIQKGQFKIM